MTPLRRAALDCLREVPGAFLRCDRGERLYVTNALLRTEREIDWDKGGFLAQAEGKLTFLTPKNSWIDLFTGWLEPLVQEKRLSLAVQSACFGGIDEEDMRLLIEGIKRLEMKADAADYEKLVRQRAAVCLRKRSGGGTMIACALIVDLMNEGGLRDEN